MEILDKPLEGDPLPLLLGRTPRESELKDDVEHVVERLFKDAQDNQHRRLPSLVRGVTHLVPLPAVIPGEGPGVLSLLPHVKCRLPLHET